GGARGIVVGVSTDAGNHWTPVVLPGVSLASGGTYARATDPWLAFAPNGDLYAATLAWDPADPADPLRQYPFDELNSAVLISKSTDGGLTWAAPVALIADASPGLNEFGHPGLLFNDKETVTVDPHDPNHVYVTWTRIDFDFVTGNFSGPTYFARSTDAGRTWEPARPIYYDPAPFSQTIGNQIVVLPDGTLVNMFAQGSEGEKNGDIAVIRSTDHGLTWSAPIVVATGAVIEVEDPETGVPIRSADTIPEIAVDPNGGALYVVAQGFDLADGTSAEGIIFSQSLDGGLHWSRPVSINRTPAGLPEANRQAFDPSVRVGADGTVAVTYYDTRNNTAAPGLLTDAWAVFADPRDRRNAPGGLADPANWGREVRLTPRSFDVESAPQSTNQNGGYFLGDYQGLAAVGNRFVAVFAVAGTGGPNTAGVVARWVAPAGHGNRGDFLPPSVDDVGPGRHKRERRWE
ncbi:MAG TPA: sialidase family protein, partial [Gemmataceae bacterium]|nr:sialidase family protein [Gemmataceae bacterium]